MATRSTADPGEQFSKAVGLLQQGKADQAETILRNILQSNGESFAALHLLGVACHKQNKKNEAVGFLEKARALNPESADTHFNLGVAFRNLERFEDAIESYHSVVQLRPGDSEAYVNLAFALNAVGRHEEALECCRRAHSLSPQKVSVYNNLGTVLHALGRYEEAAESYREVLRLDPHHARAHYNLGLVLEFQNQYEEAIASYDRALEIDPDYTAAFGHKANLARQVCDWSRFDQMQAGLAEKIRNGERGIPPFTVFSYLDDPEVQLKCAQLFCEESIGAPPAPVTQKATAGADRIRIAYVSGTFRSHATAYHVAELFELHDRDRFEVIGISYGPDDNSPIRQRIADAFDDFVDVRGMGDRAVAEMIADRGIHITIDLMGYTENSRPGIHARRPAPIHANYLGFPGTMGAGFVDYILVDSFVAPADQQPFFTENLVHLPDCYWVTDSKLEIAEKTPSRVEAGLPEKGFVFCSFNNAYKITPEIFGIWARLLNAVPDSVLWLLEDNQVQRENLRREAAAREVSPDRLIFAPRASLADHLARHRLADLFLDTLPFNAHTTAGDALWAGLPVVTCSGRSFASRVAASMLHALDLPELATGSLEEYEALALKLAKEPESLDALRAKLARNQTSARFFDCPRFARHVEAAYETMFGIWRKGEKPEPFAVDPGTREPANA